VSHDLQLERTYDAAPEVVFDAFIDPDAQRELYADAPDWMWKPSATFGSGAAGASRSGLREARRRMRPTCSRWWTVRGDWSTPRR